MHYKKTYFLDPISHPTLNDDKQIVQKSKPNVLALRI